MRAPIRFYDLKPEGLSLYEAVLRGFAGERKWLPPKFFYDARSSELFDEICRQPEYYLSDVERAMLTELAWEIARLTGPQRVVIEPGAGNAAKFRLLIKALASKAYVPMDISCAYLKEAAQVLAGEYPPAGSARRLCRLHRFSAIAGDGSERKPAGIFPGVESG